jgi:transmembrane sensor
MERLNILFKKYKNNQCSQEEIDELLDYFSVGNNEAALKAEIDQYLSQAYMDSPELEQITNEVYDNIQARIKEKKSVRKRIFQLVPLKWVAAASIILCLSVGSYFLLHKIPTPQIVQNKTHDILPGGNKAILILGNGKQIILTDAKNGILADLGNVAIHKTADGEVVYNSAKNKMADVIEYNTLTTPRGGQYHLTLADGTDVWLNAASSIKYPTTFAGKTRQVEITGEAYFEVAHNASKPFLVASNGQTIEVLGTHFNVNSYTNETTIKTTLLEGSVKVSNGIATTVLKPGQQSRINIGSNNQKISVINGIDTEEAVAWKNGFFHYDNIELKDLMRQISRWYDIEVVYQGQVANHEYLMDLKMKTNLSNLLKILEQGGIHFKIEDRKLIVMP